MPSIQYPTSATTTASLKIPLHHTPPISPDLNPHDLTLSTNTKIVRNSKESSRIKKPRFTLYQDQYSEMEEVDIPSERVPEGLKACEQILKRAKELRKAEPVVAYWCCFSAAEKVLKVHGRTKEQTNFLMSLLDALEKMKAVLANNDAVTNEAAGAAHIENFALKVFMSADNADRNGITGKETIRKFVVAGQFIEVLKCFENGMTEEMEQKLQYARWKAADGAKALREGRVPTSGPPIPEIEDDPALFPALPGEAPSSATQPSSQPNTASTLPTAQQPTSSSRDVTPLVSPKPSPATKTKINLPGIDTTPPADENMRTPTRSQSSGSGAWSTVATPGLQDDGTEPRFDLPPIIPPSAPPVETSGPKSPTSGGAGKNVRFMGPDGAPLSPAQTVFTVDSFDVPDAPPPTVYEPSPPATKLPPAASTQPTSRPRGDSNSSNATAKPRDNNSPKVSPPSSGNRPRGDSNSTNRPTNISTNGTSSGIAPPRGSPLSKQSPLPSAQQPPSGPSRPSQPSIPSVPPSGGALGLTSPPPSAPPISAMQMPPPSATFIPTRKQIEATQKHARWAISALEFDDVDTARAELRKALASIGG